MQGEVNFKAEIEKFIAMAIEIWPYFTSGMKHLHDIGQPKQQSYLPQRPYNQMSEQQFTKTIVDDLVEFIMAHDVREEDLQDYLYDILDLLMMEEQPIVNSNNPTSIQYMARYTFEVIQQLQNGKNDKITKFEQDFYVNVKQFKGQIIQKNNSQDQDSQEYDEQSYSSDEEIKQVLKVKSQQQKRRQQQLEDDGWTIVKK